MAAPETCWQPPWSYTGTHAEAVALAMERQRMASEGPLSSCPRWAELTQHERDMSVLAAANWLTALRRVIEATSTPEDLDDAFRED
jgi:hypothetical protein